MKILLTGGAGFIGSHIADAYINEGHTVFVIDNLSTGYKSNVNSSAVFINADIRSSELDELFKKEQFDIVNHHAAQMDVRRSVNNPVFDADTNILGSINLLENSVKYNVKKFIFASSGGAVYGEQESFPASEEHPQYPLSPYGISKLAVEKYIYFYNQQYGLNYSILRYANVYGPRQNPAGEAGVVAIFTSRLLKHQQPIINGTGKQTRDYVYVGDAVKANFLMLLDKLNETYNIGTGIETDVNSIFRMLNDITGVNAEEKHGPAAAGEQMRSVVSSEKVYSIFRWKPDTLIHEGLKNTVEYFRNSTITV